MELPGCWVPPSPQYQAAWAQAGPAELGCGCRCAGYSSVEGLASTSHHPEEVSPIQILCMGVLPKLFPCGANAAAMNLRTPWVPTNPPAPGFPRLRETFKLGLGSHHVLLISSGRSTLVLSHTICSAQRPTTRWG